MKKRAVFAGLVLGLSLAVAPAQASTTQAWTSYGFTSAYPIGDRINAIASWGTKIFVGGTFTNAGGDADADYLAVYDTSTPNNGWTSVASSNSYTISGEVKTLLVVGNRLFVGGSFSSDATNSLDECIRMLNLAVSPPAWVNLAGGTIFTGTNKVINDIELDTDVANSILIAGGFASIQAGPRYVARYNFVTGTYSAIGGGISYVDASTIAQSIAQVGSKYFVGFSNVGNQKPLLQVVDGANAATSLYWSTSGNWPYYYAGIKGVYDLRVSGTNLYVGGNFEDAGGSIPNFAKFDTTLGSVHNSLAWTAPASNLICDEGIQNACISKIQILNSEIYLGGFIGFGHVNTTLSSFTQYLSGGGSSDGNAIEVSGSQLLVGGTFSNAGGLSDADSFVSFTPASTSTLDGFSTTAGAPAQSFAASTYAYTKATTESSLQVTVDPTDTGSLVQYSTDGNTWTSFSMSTLQSAVINLPIGDTTIRMKVFPAGLSGATSTYSLTVTRSTPVLTPPPSSDPAPVAETPTPTKANQTYSVPARLKVKKTSKLSLKSAQALNVSVSVTGSCSVKLVTKKIKKVKVPQYIELKAGKKPGTCTVRVTNSGDSTYSSLAQSYAVAVVKK